MNYFDLSTTYITYLMTAIPKEAWLVKTWSWMMNMTLSNWRCFLILHGGWPKKITSHHIFKKSTRISLIFYNSKSMGCLKCRIDWKTAQLFCFTALNKGLTLVDRTLTVFRPLFSVVRFNYNGKKFFIHCSK